MSITIRQHWDNVGQLKCVVSGSNYITLHHCHGGSIIETWGSLAMPGTGQKQSDWLVIPLAAPFHTGQWGIDTAMSVLDWEREFGTQVQHLKTVAGQLDYCIFTHAGLNPPPTL